MDFSTAAMHILSYESYLTDGYCMKHSIDMSMFAKVTPIA